MKRTELLTLRLNTYERDLVERAAEAQHLRASEYLRTLLREAAAAATPDKRDGNR